MRCIKSFNPRLSTRDIELITLIAKGYATKEIAAHLNVNTRSIEKYRSRLLEKTGCPNSVALVVFAIYKKFINPKSCLRYV
ncbi:response regulator transcription factor [Nostoc ellipsosporum NOK]|nr:response regulator transcription factor [Nostoc ellipsosporum NOK]